MHTVVDNVALTHLQKSHGYCDRYARNSDYPENNRMQLRSKFVHQKILAPVDETRQ